MTTEQKNLLKAEVFDHYAFCEDFTIFDEPADGFLDFSGVEMKTETNMSDPFLQKMISSALQTIAGGNAELMEVDSSEDEASDDEGANELREKCISIINDAAKLVPTPTARQLALRRYRRKRKARIMGLTKAKKYRRRQAYAAKRPRQGGKLVAQIRFVNPWFD